MINYFNLKVFHNLFDVFELLMMPYVWGLFVSNFRRSSIFFVFPLFSNPTLKNASWCNSDLIISPTILYVTKTSAQIKSCVCIYCMSKKYIGELCIYQLLLCMAMIWYNVLLTIVIVVWFEEYLICGMYVSCYPVVKVM